MNDSLKLHASHLKQIYNKAYLLHKINNFRKYNNNKNKPLFTEYKCEKMFLSVFVVTFEK